MKRETQHAMSETMYNLLESKPQPFGQVLADYHSVPHGV